ncbi:MAG: ATP-binding protein [Acidobacteria bacterium]|nr:ATP-binding protein [Acidobacteriota bacterium]
MRKVTSSSREARARRIEAELHERVQVLDAIIRSMGDGVVVTDAQLRVTLANPSAKRILGSDIPDRIPDEWPRDTGLFYVDRETRVPAEEMPSARAVRGETIEDLVLFVRGPSIPEGVYISVNASPLRDEAQRIAGSVVVFRDVSERKMQEEALLQAFAHGRLEVIDTLQHNIGNAINSVATGVDTLHEWLEDNELIRRFDAVAGLVREHERDWIAWLAHDDQGRRIRPFLLALISDLTREQRSLWKTTTRVRERVRHIVDVIRAQAAFTNGALERTAIDLAQALADAVTVVREGLGRRGVEIEVDCSRAPGRLLVQEGRFQQLLVNLLLNALEATDERAARLGTDGWRPRVRLSAYAAGEEGMLAIDVIDNGIGLEASQLPSIFAAGYTTKKDGTGLGLHSAANFVIGSGGSIRPLSDGIGRGTTMRVMLRLSEPGPEEPAADGEEPAADGGDE